MRREAGGNPVAAVEVRAATPADAEAIASLFEASRLAAMPGLPKLHAPAETRAWFAGVVLPFCAVRVAEVAGRLLGFAAVNGDELAHLYVEPSSWRQGVGGLLLAEAKRLSPVRLTLHAFADNAAARAFYEKHGFEAVAFGNGSGNEEGLPDVRYEWRARER